MCIIGYYGGLRNHELRSLEFGKTFSSGEQSLEVDEVGYWFVFERAKQRGNPEVSSFCVPRRREDWLAPSTSSERNASDYDPASVIDHYLEHLESDLNCSREKLSGSFFKSAQGLRGKSFKQVPMGKNKIAEVGREFAEELCLPNAQSFSGHCWRRSCGTNASDAGVNVTTLMSQMGWTTPKTAIGYIKKSRMTSFQMSMFLTNIQRQNKDVDAIFGGVGSASSEELKDEKKKKRKLRSPVDLPPPVPVVDESLSLKFLGHLTGARNSGSLALTREKLDLESEKQLIMNKIMMEPASKLRPTSSSVVAVSAPVEVERLDLSVGNDGIGGGGGGEEMDGGGGEAHFEVDPRVSSIMRNFQNNGTVNVHFHFSK